MCKIDDTHKLAYVSNLGTNINGPYSIKEPVGLVLVDNKWLVDFSLVVSKETIPVTGVNNESIELKEIQKATLLTGYEFLIVYKNLREDYSLIQTNVTPTIATLKTNEESISKELSDSVLIPGEQTYYHLIFDTLKTKDPVKTESITISNIQLGNNTMPDLNQTPIELFIPLN